MDFNGLMAVFLVISRPSSVVSSGFTRAFVPAGGATSCFLLVLREAEKVSKKDVLPRPRSNWGALPAGLYSDMTCQRALAPFMTTGRRPVSQLESREEIGP